MLLLDGPQSDVYMFLFTSGVCLLLEQTLKLLSNASVVSTVTSRRLTHALMGPVFIACWPLFSSFNGGGVAQSTFGLSSYALLGLIPFVITIKYLLIGLGLLKDEGTIRLLCRTGNRKEILFGPFIYGLIFSLLPFAGNSVSLFIPAVISLCFGDAMAATVGQKFGKKRWPVPRGNPKTFVGTIGFVLSGTFGTIMYTKLLEAYTSTPIFSSALPLSLLLITNVIVGVVEAVSPSKIDNLTIFITGVLCVIMFSTT
eukprot:m.27559 g.27559  ORF g.27559 m.27559 type:complete len:256 (+) comp5955_c0_seq1:74-841(+)